MNYNDISNAATMEGMVKIRKRDWSSAVMMWLLSMVTGVNGKKVYESAIGCAFQNDVWREMVRKSFASTEIPCECGKDHRGSCGACHELKKNVKKSSRTIWQCIHCGPICKKCQNDGSHERYRDMIKKGYIRPFHTYPNGKKLSKLIQRDVNASQNLILL